MKKTISLLLAIVVAAISICTLTICAFADPAEGETQATQATQAATEPSTIDLEDPRDTQAATEPTTEEKKDDATTSTKADDTSSTTKTSGDVVTNPSGVTSIDDGDATTKKPAAVDDDIPNTGSGIVVPAIALLALAGGVTVAVKSKKD